MFPVAGLAMAGTDLALSEALPDVTEEQKREARINAALEAIPYGIDYGVKAVKNAYRGYRRFNTLSGLLDNNLIKLQNVKGEAPHLSPVNPNHYLPSGLEPEKIMERREILKRINRINTKYNAPKIDLEASATPQAFENAIDKSIKQYNTVVRGVRPNVRMGDLNLSKEEQIKRMKQYATTFAPDTGAGRAGLSAEDLYEKGSLYTSNSVDTGAGYANVQHRNEAPGRIAKIRFLMKDRSQFPTAEDHFIGNMPYFRKNLDEKLLDVATLKSKVSPSQIFKDYGVISFRNPGWKVYMDSVQRQPLSESLDTITKLLDRNSSTTKEFRKFSSVVKDVKPAFDKYMEGLKLHYPDLETLPESSKYKIIRLAYDLRALSYGMQRTSINKFNIGHFYARKRKIIEKLHERLPYKAVDSISTIKARKDFIRNNPDLFNLYGTDLRLNAPDLTTSEALKRTRKAKIDLYSHFIKLGEPNAKAAEFLEWVDPLDKNKVITRAHLGNYTEGLSTKTFSNGGKLSVYN